MTAEEYAKKAVSALANAKPSEAIAVLTGLFEDAMTFDASLSLEWE